MRDDNFDWFNDKSVVCKRQDAIAVYLNPDKDVVIRREADWNEEEDTFIVVSRSRARAVIEAIERLLLPQE